MKKLCEDAAMAMYREGRLDQEIADAIGYSRVSVTNWRNDRGLPSNRKRRTEKMIDAYKAAMPIERVQELAQAEKDGRLVVLPMPVGAGKVAYGLTDSHDGQQRIVTIECDYLEKLEIWDNPGHEIVVEVDGWEIGKSDIGKTVFLTREEAEAALKKREADNEAD